MEKVPAACAMEWSIHLDKSLRSKKHGKAIEAIQEIGSKIEWWNRDSELTQAEYRMFGLIAGEDKLFLNAIFLRLGDAFRLGDKLIKITILKVFLKERKKRKKGVVIRGGGCEGVLSKGILVNYKEVLRRVMVVFETGDVEERALALGLVGCWANLAKDSAHIRYLVLSNLVSCNEFEVKASLFAAGCFCENEDDFATVFLEMLVNNLLSCETSSLRLAGARAFAKLCHPFSLADRAYKTGLRLALDSAEDEFVVVMLISLSQISSRWTLLIHRQMEVLLSFFSKKPNLIQSVAFRCLYFIFARRTCHLSLSSEDFQDLLKVIDQVGPQLDMHFESLKLLHKVFVCHLASVSDKDVLSIISILFRVVKDIIKGSVESEKLLSIQVLIDISKNILKLPEVELNGICSTLVSELIILISYGMSTIVDSKVENCHSDTKMDLAVKYMLNFLYYIVKENSIVAVLTLDKVCAFIQDLVKSVARNGLIEKQDGSNPEVTAGQRQTESLMSSEMMIRFSRVVGSCIENHPDELIKRALNSVNFMVNSVVQCGVFDVYTHSMYMVLFHSIIVHFRLLLEIDKVINLSGSSGLSCDEALWSDSYIIDHKKLLVEHANKVLRMKDYWSSYKLGKYAACRGVWSLASHIFDQLMKMVQSDHCDCWLNALAQISCSERQIELVGLLPLKVNASDKEDFSNSNINLHNFIETLSGVSKIYYFSEQNLGASTKGHLFVFQRWLFILRAKVLETVADVIKLSHTISCALDNAGNNGHLESNGKFHSMAYPLILLSNRLKSLALEFDILAMSFIDMDRNSMMAILKFALICSLLAFCTGNCFFIPNSHSLELPKSYNSKEQLRAVLIQDLVGRLRHLDFDTSSELRMLFKSFQGSKSSSFLHFRKLVAGNSDEASALVKICKYAVLRSVDLQHKVVNKHHNECLSQIYKDGLQVLLNAISIWVSTPFRIPCRFFSVRQCFSSELYIMNGEGINLDGHIISGVDQPLDLCLQLRNTPCDLPVRLSKLYCILRCSTLVDVPGAMEENKRRRQLDIEDWRSEDMIDLNVRLMHHVNGSTNLSGIRDTNNGGGFLEEKFVCFHVNSRGQGFSTCLLTSSTFPMGCYKIMWCGCLIDDRGSYWSLLPLNAGPIFIVQQSSI
ncbi:hypothetical protein Leryth_020917 [Lithospermum erythrorhizon]|nr:hypothetical protein Leryth_020917 [Lithospermum erythrorhizon]